MKIASHKISVAKILLIVFASVFIIGISFLAIVYFNPFDIMNSGDTDIFDPDDVSDLFPDISDNENRTPIVIDPKNPSDPNSSDPQTPTTDPAENHGNEGDSKTPINNDPPDPQVPIEPAVDPSSGFDDTPEPPIEEPDEHYLELCIKINELKQHNPEIVGIINIPEVNITQPLTLHSTDNQFYTNHNYLGEQSNYGALYLDCRNSEHLMLSRNNVIYGHNLTFSPDKMFSPLVRILDNEKRISNTYIEIATLDGIYTYLVFAWYETSVNSGINYRQTHFASDKEYADFIDMIKSKNRITNGLDIGETPASIITISTCINSPVIYNGRYAIHAALVNIRK